MAKLKNLSDLGDIYASSIHSEFRVDEKVKEFNEILNTDTSNYLSESNVPKVGEGFGKQKEELAKGTGPHAADNFKKVTEEQDPGASKKKAKHHDTEDKKEKEGEDEEGGETEEELIDDAKKHVKFERAKFTQSKEKIQERVDSASKNTKYKKPTITMSKSKFDQLYEDALNSAPFAKDGGAADAAPTDDVGADMDTTPDTDMGPETDTGGESVTITLDRALAQKLHDALMGQLGGGAEDLAPDTGADIGGDEEAPMMEEEDDDTMEEAVDAEDLGHPGPGSHAKSEQLKDGHKIHKVGALKAAGAASEQGGPKGGDGTVNKAKDFDKALQKPTGSREVGNLKVSKGTGNAFE